jgi:hypothetical protein
MEPQGYTPNERNLFEQEVEQILRTELPTVREEEVRAAARRAAARELEQQREVLRDELDDEVVAITEEPADLRAAANRQAPSKVLLGVVLLLLLLFTLAVLGRLPRALAAFGNGATPSAPAANTTGNAPFDAILGAGGASAVPAITASPSTTANASAIMASTPATAQTSASTPPRSSAPVPNASSRVRVAMLPHTGISSTDLFVDPLFGHAYWQHGGVQRFGHPTSSLITMNEQQTQTFEHARFEYRPEHAGTPDAIHIQLTK